jgi:hypothetical protein
MDQVPQTFPQLIWYLLMFACTIIGFFTTFTLKSVVSSIKEIQKLNEQHSREIAQLQAAHGFHHPGEITK